MWVHCSSPSVAFGSFQNLRVFLTYFNFILLLFIPQDRRERGLATMKELLRQKTYQGALSKLSSPLDPSFKLRNLKLVFVLWVLLVCSFSHGPVLVASSSDESQQEFKKARESACQSSKHWRHQLACFFCRLRKIFAWVLFHQSESVLILMQCKAKDLVGLQSRTDSATSFSVLSLTKGKRSKFLYISISFPQCRSVQIYGF